MNKIIVFSDTEATEKKLASGFGSNWQIETQPHDKLRKILKTPDSEILYIFDYASAKKDSREKDLFYFVKKQNLYKAVADVKNEVADPADLLMKNCDYINSSLLDQGYRTARFKKFRDFIEKNIPEAGTETMSAEKKEHKALSDGWKEIKSGKSYSFFMLYTEISIPDDWKKKSGKDHLDMVKQTFQKVAERETESCDGRIWIWNEYGGLILFPYTGNFCIPVIAPLRMLLNRLLISVEDFNHHSPVNIRAAMHLGKTVWQSRGKTGTIISDSINSIFHLGTQHAPLNCLDITADVYEQLQPGLKSLFKDAGTFEGRNIYRLQQFEILA